MILLTVLDFNCTIQLIWIEETCFYTPLLRCFYKKAFNKVYASLLKWGNILFLTFIGNGLSHSVCILSKFPTCSLFAQYTKLEGLDTCNNEKKIEIYIYKDSEIYWYQSENNFFFLIFFFLMTYLVFFSE